MESETAIADGCQQGNVFGTYLHGVLDTPEITQRMVNALLQKKGITSRVVQTVSPEEYKEQQYDLLAQSVRESIDMGLLYTIIEQGMNR
jgi:adenosylcobyric acid synthase